MIAAHEPVSVTGGAPPVRAGGLAGIAGLATFLVLHHAWIVPIWFIAPAGALVAAGVGAAVGSAYGELLPHLPPRPWTAIAVSIGMGVVLLPAFAIAELLGAAGSAAVGAGGMLVIPGSEAATRFVIGLLLPTTIAGAGGGWLIARSRRAAWTTGLATFAFALGPGHNIPFLGATAAVAEEVVIVGAVVVTASVVLMESHAWLTRRGALRPIERPLES
ncbi:MAG: hypothetical protein AB1736_04515 [Chloroflexota bacterium]